MVEGGGGGGFRVVKPCRERHNECNAEIRRLNPRTSERERERGRKSGRETETESARERGLKAETERNRGESERSNGIYSPNFLD